jgi:hypothetical protein
VSAISVDVYFKNRFFHSKEFDASPIKSNIDYLFNPINKDLGQNRIYKIKQNKIETSDSWLGFGGSQEFTYFSLEPDHTYIKYSHIEYRDKMQPYLGYWFLEDEQKESSTREVITLWDVLGNLGGIMEIVIISCTLLVGSVQEFMFDSSVIQKIFLKEAGSDS